MVLAGVILIPVLLFSQVHSPVPDNPPSHIKGATTSTGAPPAPQSRQPGLPLRLRIPAISLDVIIAQVGLTAGGAMDEPKTPHEPAWYNLGPRPGEAGSAVIAGHYGQWANGDPSVFDHLHLLRPGHKIHIDAADGATITFVVREKRSYDPAADASTVFNARDGRPHLNLITCEGAWNKTSRSYSKRLVVFSDKE